MRKPSASTTTPVLSGIECAIRTSSIRNGPTSTGPSSGTDLDKLGPVGELVLGELRGNEAERELRAEDARDVDLSEEVGQPANVILVRVGEDDRRDGAGTFGEVRDVGQDEIDAEMLVAGEREPCVDHERPVLPTRRRSCSSRSRQARRAG